MTVGKRSRHRSMRGRGPGLGCLALAVALCAAAPAARAQEFNGDGAAEIRLLRQATTRERAGDLLGAERILRGILEQRPTSLSALLSLERLLRMQGRLEEMLPPIERLLAVDGTSAIGHQMRIRTLSALNRVEALAAAGEDWIRASPNLETPYREVARVWIERGERERALQVLEEGRDRIDRDDALALELGDVYAALGQIERAVDEWDEAIGRNADGFMLVRRRLGALPDGGARLLPELIDALAGDDTSLARRQAAVDLAIDAGLAERAQDGAREVADELDDDDRRSFLVEVARRADGANLPALAHWAYAELVEHGGPEDQLLALRTRLAELALIMGDTAQARRRYRTLEQLYAVGSPERRQATALRIELTARDRDVDAALREFEQFRREFPEAPELDRVAAAIAGALLDRGEAARAERVLTGVSGPRSSLVRGRIALRGGDIPSARAALLTAAPMLRGAEATETIMLATLLGRISPAGGALIGRAMSRIADEQPDEAVELVSETVAELPIGDRAAVLDFAAGVADRFALVVEAERLRRIIVTEFPQSPQAAGAMLALARTLTGRQDALLEARELLVRLILEYPRSALVPQARRELDRLQGRVPENSQ